MGALRMAAGANPDTSPWAGALGFWIGESSSGARTDREEGEIPDADRR